MGKVTICNDTTKNPIVVMGEYSSICYGSNTADVEKNYKRGYDCLTSGHGRVLEYVQVYVIIEGYSARVMREIYTHIAGAPSRLQASTRYIDYEHGFDYITPPAIQNNEKALGKYERAMKDIAYTLNELSELGITKEDCANLLPLGMTSKMVLRTNLRNLIDMSHQRMCTRAYWEYRDFMKELAQALSEYDDQWATIVKETFKPKCEIYNYCTESRSCGRRPKKE
jgi:thymidylate synthase (FAD)